MTLLDRRHFLKTSATAAGALALGGACAQPDADEASTAAGATGAAPAPLSILILGGTGFIGPHMVRYAQSRGHEITLFNRGRTNTHLFPDVEKLVGDRASDLTALEDRTWDAVIDNSGFIPRHVRESAAMLSESGRYAFVSTLSAYKDLAAGNITENYELASWDEPETEDWDGRSYGPYKALCEQAVQEVFGERATIVRPGYIVGPGDSTDRWTYWPVRTAAGGDMMVPGAPDYPIQFIDARDLGAWVVRMLESDTSGVYNAVGPSERIEMGAFMDACRDASGSDATFHWVDESFVLEQNVFFPIWAPRSEGPYARIHEVSNAAAIQAGYESRPVSETIADTLEWWNGLTEEDREDGALRAGLRKQPELAGGPHDLAAMMQVEASLLEAWGARDM